MGKLSSERVEELISVNFQVSECYCEFLYRQAVHTGFSLDVAENTPIWWPIVIIEKSARNASFV